MVMKKREIEGSSGYMHALSSISGDPQGTFKGDERFFCGNKNMVFQRKNEDSCSSSSSSIGKNSDISEGSMEKSDDSDEVQSSYKSPLSSMEALEQVLPIRKGISRFYNGKSKSFTSLREASATKDLAKREKGLIRKKRRNLVACGFSNKSRGGISKRVTNSSKTTLALAAAAAMNCSGLISTSTPFVSRLNPPPPCLSPLNFWCWRSFSLADLQQCDFVSLTLPATAAAATNMKVEKEPT